MVGRNHDEAKSLVQGACAGWIMSLSVKTDGLIGPVCQAGHELADERGRNAMALPRRVNLDIVEFRTAHSDLC